MHAELREAALRGLARLEKQDRDLAEVEVDEVLGLVSHVRAKVASHDAVPCRVVLLVKLLLDVRRDILLDVVLLHRLGSAIDSVLLHVLCNKQLQIQIIPAMLEKNSSLAEATSSPMSRQKLCTASAN